MIFASLVLPKGEAQSDVTQDSRSLSVTRISIGAMFVWMFFENYTKGAYTPVGYRGVLDYYLKTGQAPATWKRVVAFVAGHASIDGPLQVISELGTAWIREPLVPTIAAAALALTRPGRTWGVDARLAIRWPKLPMG